MNRFKTILILVMAIMVMMTVNVYAAEPQLTISGESEAKAGETKTLTLKLVSETSSGALGGKISYNENISSISISGKNNWSFQYNESNGKLVGQKASGTTNEDIMDITYTLKPEATGKAVITFSDLKVTFTNFEETIVPNFSKEITIPVETPEQPEQPEQPEEPETVSLSSIAITKAPTKVKYTEGEKFDKTGMEVMAKYSNGTSKVVTNYTFTPNGNLIVNDKKIVISYTENGITKTIEQAITVEKKVSQEPEVPATLSLSSISIKKAPTKVKYTEGEKFDKTGMEIAAKYSDGTSKVIKNYTFTPNGSLKTTDKKIVISYTENDVTKTVEQSISVTKKAGTNNNQQQQSQQQQSQQQQQTQQGPVVVIGGQNGQPDNTVANKELAKAGIDNLVFYAIILLTILGIVYYIKYNKMKDIK